MSRYSLDSLDNDSSLDNKYSTRLMKVHSVPSLCDKIENPDAEFNEWEKVEVAIPVKDPEKSSRNALIENICDDVGNGCRNGGQLVASVGETSDFQAKCPVAKKFNVAKQPTSSPLLSSTEFRLRVSLLPSSKSPNRIEGFMKAGKKLGKARRAIVDKGKKEHVSYLDLHRRKFGVECRPCILSPEGRDPSICGDRTEKHFGCSDDRAAATVSRDDNSEHGFYRRVVKLVGSRERCETRSCEAFEPSEADEGVSKSSCEVSECFLDVVYQVERRRKVYKPYTIEDYKCLSVPRVDRSLGPDRIAMEGKAEWLMRRRSYGDSVSARNRQRILQQTQKLKESRRADVQKLRLPPLTDLENPATASKADDKQKGSKIIVRSESLTRPKRIPKKQTDKRASKNFPLVASGGEPALSKPKPAVKVISASSDVFKTPIDTAENLMDLRNLRLRHLEEKRRIDLLFKRSLCI